MQGQVKILLAEQKVKMTFLRFLITLAPLDTEILTHFSTFLVRGLDGFIGLYPVYDPRQPGHLLFLPHGIVNLLCKAADFVHLEIYHCLVTYQMLTDQLYRNIVMISIWCNIYIHV